MEWLERRRLARGRVKVRTISLGYGVVEHRRVNGLISEEGYATQAKALDDRLSVVLESYEGLDPGEGPW